MTEIIFFWSGTVLRSGVVGALGFAGVVSVFLLESEERIALKVSSGFFLSGEEDVFLSSFNEKKEFKSLKMPNLSILSTSETIKIRKKSKKSLQKLT